MPCTENFGTRHRSNQNIRRLLTAKLIKKSIGLLIGHISAVNTTAGKFPGRAKIPS